MIAPGGTPDEAQAPLAVAVPVAVPSLNDLPSHILRQIVIGATTGHEDLLRWVAACAKVSREWWHIVRCSPAYGGGLPVVEAVPSSGRVHADTRARLLAKYGAALTPELPPPGTRAAVLQRISIALRNGRTVDGLLQLNMADLTSPRQYTAPSRWAVENRLSDEGCRVLGAALIFCDQLAIAGRHCRPAMHPDHSGRTAECLWAPRPSTNGADSLAEQAAGRQWTGIPCCEFMSLPLRPAFRRYWLRQQGDGGDGNWAGWAAVSPNPCLW
jgi:hypothetical protein